ncbi:MAG TPA: cupin domain-containing protein [Solirubrobacterales bacterium]|jgi:uncharacterized RmlC-like cupin family protein
MSRPDTSLRSDAQLIDPRAIEALDVLGPTVQIVTPFTGDDRSPCLIRGTIPAGGVVPLHSHPEPETFVALAGHMEGFVGYASEPRWEQLEPGRVLHVPGGVPHAWRNRSGEPAVSLVVTEEGIARFFREVGRPAGEGGGEPGAGELARFAEAAARFGHWLAGPEENAAIGIDLPAPRPPAPNVQPTLPENDIHG